MAKVPMAKLKILLLSKISTFEVKILLKKAEFLPKK